MFDKTGCPRHVYYSQIRDVRRKDNSKYTNCCTRMTRFMNVKEAREIFKDFKSVVLTLATFSQEKYVMICMYVCFITYFPYLSYFFYINVQFCIVWSHHLKSPSNDISLYFNIHLSFFLSLYPFILHCNVFCILITSTFIWLHKIYYYSESVYYLEKTRFLKMKSNCNIDVISYRFR